ncbi:unnamed protein product [Mytilus coruscus]|uniref:Uncharacterized protein n=1 Tax=Mytilus coruscus TaxID=42192 RepID=A0A6J8ESR0_MYTCO|nr:unnamed protein product [Mytilus coruscus]
MLTDICSKHGYELFIRNYFETSHANGSQDAAGGFLKNQVDMAVFRGNEIIQSPADFFKYCGKHLKDTKSLYCKRRKFRYVESIDRDTISFKPVPGIRSLHQVFSSLDDANLTLRYLSCYSCENCLVGTYKDCIHNSIGSKATIPIVVENNRTRYSGPAESTENYEMEDLIPLGTILAVYTDEADSNYDLFKADACPETLKKDITDDWGVTYIKGSKVVRGLYFDQTKKLLSYKLLDKETFHHFHCICYLHFTNSSMFDAWNS